MFSQVSVCPRGEGRWYHYPTCHWPVTSHMIPSPADPRPGYPPLVMTSSGGHRSGWYTSCWNAVLFLKMFLLLNDYRSVSVIISFRVYVCSCGRSLTAIKTLRCRTSTALMTSPRSSRNSSGTCQTRSSHGICTLLSLPREVSCRCYGYLTFNINTFFLNTCQLGNCKGR